ncbi:MAG: tRNA (guanosine(46)-N7)-methyltransferase TrmB [Planctomycetota bacterium]|nr:tRNA (guanosine(46)-N7)-methyltransferase TrmB [Planctomycetota bacterium]
MTRLRRHRLLTDSESAREVRLQDLYENSEASRCFNVSGDLWLEVGTGKDTHILERSLRHPDSLHLGIEQTRKKFEMMLRKAEMLECQDNLKLLHADAFAAVRECFADKSLAGAFLLFPDPWPKERHARRRLLQESFLSLIASKLRPGAQLEIRTDDLPNAEQAHEALLEIEVLERLTGNAAWLDAPIDPANHVETLFERRFRNEGKGIYYFYLKKISDGLP